MNSSEQPGTGIMGSLRSAGGAGVVRIEDRYATGIDDLWSALTEPGRLARWYGEVDGDLRPGGEWQIHAENLAAYLAGRDRGDNQARWGELVPPYQQLAAGIR
jgi:uncharacterized protein YndB with AHSA1/START domain